MTGKVDGGAAVHRIPVIDKMMQVLDLIEESPGGLSINAITQRSGVTRSTVYRLLNTLVGHGLVTRSESGDYRLGFRLVSLAAGVDTDISREALVAMAHPALVDLAAKTGETCKVSVLSEGKAEVADVILGTNAMAPSSRVGNTFDLHAGAASKTLLAFGPEDARRTALRKPRRAYTAATLTDAADLEREIERIREAGYSADHGEWNANVHALGAPVMGVQGFAIAALSVTYFATDDQEDVDRRIKAPLIAAARDLSYRLGHTPPRGVAEAPPEVSTGRVRSRRRS